MMISEVDTAAERTSPFCMAEIKGDFRLVKQ